MKKALAELARKAWENNNINEKVSFAPSDKLQQKVCELFGHTINEIFITGSDIRHIKNHHAKDERLRGQRDITPQDISMIYDTVSDFKTANKERNDNKGNQTILFMRDTMFMRCFALLVERGKKKAEVKTFYIHEKDSTDVRCNIPEL